MELIKRWREAVRPRLVPFCWAVASGALGGAVGLGVVTLWGHTVGW